MADVTRVVELSKGGRPVLVLDLDDGDGFQRMRDTFKYTPGPAEQQVVQSPRRYAGGMVVGESTGNASVSWDAIIFASTHDTVATRVESLLSTVEDATVGNLIEWRPDGLSTHLSSFFRLAGPGSWDPEYRWVEFHGAKCAVVKVRFPVFPLVEWAPMTIRDPFSGYSRKSGGRVNLLRNPSFEVGLTGWSQYNNELSPAATLERGDLGASKAGRWAARLTNGTDTVGQMGLVVSSASRPKVTAGETYTLSVYGSPASNGGVFRVHIHWIDSAGAIIGVGDTGSSFTGIGNQWVRASVTATAPAGAVEAQVYAWVEATSSGFVFYFDAFQFEAGSAATAYIDGDSLDAEWTGTSHDSASAELVESKLADYTFDAGSGTLSVIDGQLVPSNNTEKRLHHSARGYTYVDAQATLKITTGATVASRWNAIVLRRLDGSNYLAAQAGGGAIDLQKIDGGVQTSIASVGITVAANTTYWLRGRVEGNVFTVEWWATEPTPAGTPTTTLTHTLTGADATKFGAGVAGKAGMRLSNPDTDWRYDDFTVEPYTRRSLTLPDTLPLLDVPGTAPAKADLVITPSGGSAAPVFALAGWAALAEPWNMVWNGDFEADTVNVLARGWANGDGIIANVAATVEVDSVAHSGTKGLRILTTASGAQYQGGRFKIYRRFKKGVTYTARLRAKTDGGSAQAQLMLHDGTSTPSADGTAGSTAWEQLTVTLTPTADRDSVQVGLRDVNSNAAAAHTLWVDEVEVYEGTVAPTRATQTQGRGAAPPFGIIEAESCDTGDLTGWAIASDAGSRTGFRLIDTSVSGAETYLATYQIDPALLPADDFTHGELAIDLYALAVMSSTLVTPKLTASLRPLDGTNFGAERFTAEWGDAGKLLTVPSSGTQRRLVRLGTLLATVDRSNPRALKLTIAGATSTGSSGSFGLDYLVLTLARGHASSPTGKANDTAYPKFVASTSETTKLVRSDLSATAAKPPNAATADHGLGGEQIEIPNGDAELLVKLSSLAPDDPTSDATTEQLSHTASVTVNVTPRSRMLRSA